MSAALAETPSEPILVSKADIEPFGADICVLYAPDRMYTVHLAFRAAKPLTP